MGAGYVYILVNHSMPGLIKIGKTFRDSRERARELSRATGVPSSFEIAFEIFSLQHDILERKLHHHLENFRVNVNREFFRYPLKDAIDLIQQLERALHPDQQRDNTEFQAKSIFHDLIGKYPSWIKQDIIDVRILQTTERVWIEITEEQLVAGYLKDQKITRSDLAFIMGNGSQGFFAPENRLLENVRRFVDEFDPYSIIMTTDLFHEQACLHIDKHLNPHRPDE